MGTAPALSKIQESKSSADSNKLASGLLSFTIGKDLPAFILQERGAEHGTRGSAAGSSQPSSTAEQQPPHTETTSAPWQFHQHRAATTWNTAAGSGGALSRSNLGCQQRMQHSAQGRAHSPQSCHPAASPWHCAAGATGCPTALPQLILGCSRYLQPLQPCQHTHKTHTCGDGRRVAATPQRDTHCMTMAPADTAAAPHAHSTTPLHIFLFVSPPRGGGKQGWTALR